MGADEKASSPDEGLFALFAEDTIEKLDHGYRIVVDADDQLRLIAPSPVENPAA